MLTDNTPSRGTRSISLQSLEKSQLLDLLQQKTKSLITDRLTMIADNAYIEALRQEVEDIQEEIKRRMD